MTKQDDPQEPKRTACAYVRVSTEDQAKHRTSIDSQTTNIKQWCAAHGFDLLQTFAEPGISGADESRPQFNAMMKMATDQSHPFDLVLVYSISRFARDLALQLVKYRELDRAGVELVSISEPFSRGSTGNLMDRWSVRSTNITAPRPPNTPSERCEPTQPKVFSTAELFPSVIAR